MNVGPTAVFGAPSSSQIERAFVSDLRIEAEFGGHTARVLEAEFIVVSPGVPSNIPVLREARSLGIEVGKLRLLVIGCATLVTAAVVSIAGVVGWVGLVMPHNARMLVGPGFGVLLPAAAGLGAAYLLLVDTLARTMSAAEVPLGILTAVVGAPFFLWLLARGRRGWS
jgi:ABC-type cobalamin transport system permease subunit